METGVLLTLASAAADETAKVDFKSSFDTALRSEWCELIKDLVAMANSGGGCIVFGANDDGSRSAWDPAPILDLDPAQISDQLRRYVEGLDDLVSVHIIRRGEHDLPAMVVQPVAVPRVFTNPGNYDRGGNRQTHAFPKGGLYFRHGAKSDPADQTDLTTSMERAIDCVREKWLGNIRQVMEAPPGATVQLVTTDVRASADGSAMPIRVVTDPDAPAYRVVSPDNTHPYRQKELVVEVNKRLNGTKINGFDVQCIRRSLGSQHARPEFFHESKFGSKQYSAAFADFIVSGCESDSEFLSKAREAAKQPRP
jgi:hypothetical protein